VILAWFLVKLLKAFETNLIHKTDDSPEIIDATTATAIGKLLRAAIIITSVLIVMQSLGYSISGVLAFGGIGGLAVGFAAKDLLANFFGGLTIYLDRPFKVGDWVRSPDKEIEGTVEDIGWRLTRIRTFDKRPLYVPNATFTQISLENPSRMLNRRIKETIGIRYDDASKMQAIVNDTREMLLNHDAIDTTQTLMVNFNKFAPSSLDFFIYTFTKTTNWEEFHHIKQDVMLATIHIIQAHGAECAFPTSTLHLANYPPTKAKRVDIANP
jgi:MscS family membrane protein